MKANNERESIRKLKHQQETSTANALN